MQVADLDDEFTELLLGEYSDNFDLVPAGKVCYHIHLVMCIWVCVCDVVIFLAAGELYDRYALDFIFIGQYFTIKKLSGSVCSSAAE